MTFTEAITAVARENPEKVYERKPLTSCLYVHVSEDQALPGCLIGAALHRMGISLEDLHSFDVGSRPSGASDVMERLSIGTEVERLAAERAQRHQDAGSSWGKCLDIYLEALKTMESEL
jgi:hypothetical protein